MEKELIRDMISIISDSPIKTDLSHALSTRKWVLRLKPDSSKALQIAALAHDIERGKNRDYLENSKEKFKDYKKHKIEHSIRSADIITGILNRHGYEKKFINEVKNLVLSHEFGGDPDSDTLRDADSLSFFEKNIDQYLENNGIEKLKKKIIFMYARISEKNKKFVKDIHFKDPKIKETFDKVVNHL